MKIINVKQRTPEWDEARRGKFTGSKLKKIVSWTRATKANPNKEIDFEGDLKQGFWEVMAERVAIPAEGKPLDHGVECEPEALDLFVKESGIKAQAFGIFQDEKCEAFACSPDAGIEENGEIVAGVEIKCLSSANHLKAWFTKEIPEEYREQVLNYFMVAPAMQKLYFVFYDPRIPLKPLFWFVIERKDVEAEVAQLRLFLENTESKMQEMINSLL